MSVSLTQNFPDPKTPVFDTETGIIDPIWYRFFLSLFARTGGSNPAGATGVPGGLDTNVQYNSAGTFGGLTNIQLTTRIQRFSDTLSGAVPASAGGTANFLRADGTFNLPTVAKVNGVSYGASPATGAIPLVTGANTVTYTASTGTGAPVRAITPSFAAGAVGAGIFSPDGALSNQFSVAGVGNGADTTDDTLFTYSLPANSFDANSRGLVIEAFGGFVNNGNNKTVKLWFGTSMVMSSGVVTTANAGWWIRMLVTRTGAGAQIGTGMGIGGATVFPVPLDLVGSETDAAGITMKVTGASPTTGAAGDVVGHGMRVVYLN